MDNIKDYLSGVDHHPTVEAIVDILEARIQNTDRSFFRNIAVYHMGVCASSMRAEVVSRAFGKHTINTYNIALGQSGVGKGFSMNLMEEHIMAGFRNRFKSSTMPYLTEQNIAKLSSIRAANNDTTEEDETTALNRQNKRLGHYRFVFDGGHESAIKDMRDKLLIANCGALNYQVDEIGSNLDKSADSMTVYLELYDSGKIKKKLLKNSSENESFEELEGTSPSNALLFGAPDDIFAGGKTEDNFYSFLRIGYARRCLFALANDLPDNEDEDINALYDRMEQTMANFENTPLVDKFTELADVDYINWQVTMPRETGILHLKYKKLCERRAKKIGHNQGDHIGQTEMKHRHSRALKVAGIYAFTDKCSVMAPEHYKAAMKLVEESGEALAKILNRDMAHQRLAKYIAKSEAPLTYAEMREQLPYMPKTLGGSKEIMLLATAYGYKNNIVIKKTFSDGVEFYTGDSLQEVDLEKLTVSYSTEFAEGYKSDEAPFEKMELLTKANGMNWCNHTFLENYRNKLNVQSGFDFIVLDIDTTARIELVQEVLQKFKYFLYTTKSHTEQEHRFRVIIPMNFRLELAREEFKEFMQGVLDWLPFEVDKGVKEPERKWRANPHAKTFFNANPDAVLFDILPFIPKTSRNETHIKEQKQLQDMDGLERWFAQEWGEGVRNNLMLRFTMCLADQGMDYHEVEQRVLAFNKSLPNSLGADELRDTVLKTAASRMSQQAA
jgi:hypothetical protein